MGEPGDQQGEQHGGPQTQPDEGPEPTKKHGGTPAAHALHLANQRLPTETRVRRQERLDVQAEDDSRQEQEQREVGEAQRARQALGRGKGGELLLGSGAG